MTKWNFYTTNQIKPAGWLKRQLEIQANGLSGNLDKIWRDVRDSAWIGGDAEGWERVPYWLDGFIPLAYLLKNKDMIARAQKYIEAILSHQRSSGWICPCPDEKIPTYDTWGVQLISKVLVVYYKCTNDERIPDVLYKTLRNYYELLANGTIHLFGWGKDRWFETFIAIAFLQQRCEEPWLLELAKILKAQGLDYGAFTERWKRPLNRHHSATHIVNVTMMLKHEALVCAVLNEAYTDIAEAFTNILKAYNGTPVGLFTGDECLAGLSPIQGTELCGVAEQMYSYEWLYAYTGHKKWAERLELLAFNALPAAISDDMWTHQYDQMSNQISCERFYGKPIFRTNGKDAHLFGLEPLYGCCTANFNQAWPKLTLSAFMHKENEVISVLPIPSELNSDDCTVNLTTEYPFQNHLFYTVEAKRSFTFKIRIPSFAKNITVNGTPHMPTEELCFSLSSNQTMNINISFETTPTFIDRPYDLKSVQCGSLIFSLPISYEKRMYEYEKNGVERKFPYCDYEYIPTSDWNYAYVSKELEKEYKGISETPFSSLQPPVTLKARVKPIDWDFEEGYDTVCAKIPKSRLPIGKTKEVELYPYGCAKLRMTELPLVLSDITKDGNV